MRSHIDNVEDFRKFLEERLEEAKSILNKLSNNDAQVSIDEVDKATHNIKDVVYMYLLCKNFKEAKKIIRTLSADISALIRQISTAILLTGAFGKFSKTGIEMISAFGSVSNYLEGGANGDDKFCVYIPPTVDESAFSKLLFDILKSMGIDTNNVRVCAIRFADAGASGIPTIPS